MESSSNMSAPSIPPRPSRSQQQHPATGATMEVPKIPPRPGHGGADKSQSPNRDSFPRSPLNDLPLAMNLGNKSGSFYNNRNESGSNLDLPQRPPSVSLPSIGQEGNEYADISYDKSQDPTLDQMPSQKEQPQTRSVGSDLPLYAPRPSFSSSTAKARVSAVTRTDSNQAAAIGLGKATTPLPGDDGNSQLRVKQSKESLRRTESSASTERPASQAGDSDHGIPEIGQRVPMYPDAGDVQAPSPSPYSQTFPSGIGFHNDGVQKSGRHHGRTRSGKEVFHGPPGSYGLHGHGAPHTDRFEKAWYDKHPDALVREENGQYGPSISSGRGEWAMSSEDLNKIVRDTARRGSGFGTSPNVAGLPNEQIGYMASEEYASRMNTPQSATYQSKAHSNHSQTHVESPLRKSSFPVDVEGKEGFQKSKERHGLARPPSEYALDSETEDDDVVHIGPPTVRRDKISGNGYNPPTEDLGPHGGNTEAEGGWIDETGYGVPILASDEVAKEPGSEYLQPAVSPVQERRGSAYYAGVDSEAPPSYQSGFRNSSRTGSASNSRPGSVHGSLPGLSRFTSHDEREDMHTPLEDVEEYEPLFPDEEDKEGRPIPATEHFKRRELLMKRRFPGQDIWEDTPDSLQLQATVTTPEPQEQNAPAKEAASAIFESPETEATRKGEVSEDEKAKLIPKAERLAKSNFKPHLVEEIVRPGIKQRFPSRDIWEDSPDSVHLEATIDGLQHDEPRSPPDEGLKAGAVVRTSGRPDEGKITGDQAREGATAGAAAVEKPSIPPRSARTNASGDSPESATQTLPSMPARPLKRLHQLPPAETPPPSTPSADTSSVDTKQPLVPGPRKGPVLPERPKPQVPARPGKPIARDSSEIVPISKITSATSSGSGGNGDEIQGIMSPPPAPKPKPAVPSRPAGGKIASLKAGFLSDLDKRLQLGPQVPPKPQEKSLTEDEAEAEKAPLADARKGRARGPPRRKPAAPSVPVAVDEEREEKPERGHWHIQEPWAVWQTNDHGAIRVVHLTSGSAAANPEPLESSSKVTEASDLKSETSTIEDPVVKGMHEIQARAEEPLAAGEPTPQKQSLTANEPDSIATSTKDAGIDSPASNEIDTPDSTSSIAAVPAAADDVHQASEKATTVPPVLKAEKNKAEHMGEQALGEALREE